MSIVRDHPLIVGIFHKSFPCPPSPFLTYRFSSCRYHQRVVWHVSSVAQTQETLLPLALQHGLHNGHAFDVFALHGVMPRFAIRLHPFFSEECLHNDYHVFSRSSRNACSSLSIAVGGGRPYLRSDSIWLSALRTRSRFSGETMFSVTLLMSALYFLSSLQKRLVADLHRRERFQSGPVCRYALCCSRAHCVAPLLERLDQAQVCPHEWWTSCVSFHHLSHWRHW